MESGNLLDVGQSVTYLPPTQWQDVVVVVVVVVCCWKGINARQ